MSDCTKIVLFSALILLTVCLGCSFIVIRERIESQREDQRVLTEVAAKLGVPPNWASIREHVFCEMLQPGMTQTEVRKVLSRVGEIQVFGEPPNQEIHFTNRPVGRALSPLLLVYGKDGGLKGLGVNEFNSGPRSSCEDEWTERWTSPEN